MRVLIDHRVGIYLHLDRDGRFRVNLHVFRADSSDGTGIIEETSCLSTALIPVEAGLPDFLKVGALAHVAVLIWLAISALGAFTVVAD